MKQTDTKFKKTLRISDFLKQSHQKIKHTIKRKLKNTINKHRTSINNSPKLQSILPAFYSMSNPICTYLIHYSDTQLNQNV